MLIEGSILMVNLKDLIQKLSSLKSKLKNGNISLLDEHFQDLFIDLKGLITPQELPESIGVMQDGVFMLEKKIEEFERYISFLNKKDLIFNFIENCKDDGELAQVLLSNYEIPISMPHFSSGFLIESYVKLVENKKSRKSDINITHPEDYSPHETELPNAFDEPFREQMITYFNTIRATLPLSLDDLLNENLDVSEYYENFTYILHLIQKDYLTYNKNDEKVYDNSEVNP